MRRLRSVSLHTALALLIVPVLGVALLAGGILAQGATPQASPRPASPVATPKPVPTTTVLQAFLPTAQDVPGGLVPVQDDQRTIDQVALQIAGAGGDIAAATQKLHAWGFAGDVERQFRVPSGQQPGAGGITWLWVVIYRFADPTAAAPAYTALASGAQSSLGLTPTTIPQIGDQAEGLTRSDGLFNVWLRSGRDVIWLGGTAQKGFPGAQLEALARAIVDLQTGKAIPATPVAAGTPGAAAIHVGSTVVTTDASNMRSGPSTTASVVVVEPAGTTLTVTGPSVVGDGYTWWPVKDPNTGQTGYIASQLLQPSS